MRFLSTMEVLLFCSLFGFQISPGQDPAEIFNRGTDYYRAGKYAEAALEYQAIANRGRVSPELYFNLGNAYYRQGRLALAILAYERAQRLSPRDADIIHNLRMANLKTVDRIEPVPELFLVQWLRMLAAAVSFQLSVDVFLAMWILFFVSLAALYVVRHMGFIRVARWAIVAAGILILMSGTVLGIHAFLSRGNDQAIIVATVVTAKSSPDEQSIDAFVIHEGLKVNMSDALGDWVKITLADGKVGWVRTQQCERI